MKSICIYSLNLWFVERVPGIHPKELVKQAMIEDGYWEDCEMEDENLDTDFDHFTVSDEVAEKLKYAYDKIRVYSESESWAVCETFKAILEQFNE